jgi:hypothetical protein
MHERPNAPDRVLNYFPIYQTSQVEDFVRIKLMPVHHPFREVDSLQDLDGVDFGSFKDAFEYCQATHETTHMAKKSSSQRKYSRNSM